MERKCSYGRRTQSSNVPYDKKRKQVRHLQGGCFSPGRMPVEKGEEHD